MNADMDFSAWIGKSETEHGVATAYPADYFTATLDRDDPLFRDGDPLPPAWHYFYFHELVKLAGTGPDGHRAKGHFMPPIPFPRRMWAASDMTFESPIRIGEKVKKVVTIVDIAVKEGKSGGLCFVTTTDEVFGEDGRLTTLERRTQVYRDAADPDAPPPALTMNSHRIHYDKDYVRDEEGYPGLLVHGPLTMTLMLDLFRRELPDATMKSFSLRAVSPVYDTMDYSVHGAPGDDGTCKLWAMTGDGALAMTADVVYEG